MFNAIELKPRTRLRLFKLAILANILKVFQEMFLYEKYALTSMNMEAIGGDPKVLDTETSSLNFGFIVDSIKPNYTLQK